MKRLVMSVLAAVIATATLAIPASAADFWIVCVWCDHGAHDPRSEADRIEARLHAAGMPAAVLWSSEYTGLNPGYWVTFSGVFESSQAAATHLAALQRAGFSGHVRALGTRRVGHQEGPFEEPYWTAIAGSFRTHSEAVTLADQLLHRGFDAVVLHSSDYSNLNPGYWVTHVGRYSDQGGATSMAQRLRGAGYSGAYPREIRR